LNRETDLATDILISRFLQHLYKEIKLLDVLINPKESVREIIDIVGEYGIVSTRMVTQLIINDQIQSKTTARKLLRKLKRAGLLEIYSTKPLIKAIIRPLASLHRTELYGFPGLGISAYSHMIDFYKDLTEKAHKDERMKQKATIDRSTLKMRVDNKDLLNEKNRLDDLIQSYQLSIESARTPSEMAQAQLYQEKISELLEQRNDVLLKLEEGSL